MKITISKQDLMPMRLKKDLPSRYYLCSELNAKPPHTYTHMQTCKASQNMPDLSGGNNNITIPIPSCSKKPGKQHRKLAGFWEKWIRGNPPHMLAAQWHIHTLILSGPNTNSRCLSHTKQTNVACGEKENTLELKTSELNWFVLLMFCTPLSALQ